VLAAAAAPHELLDDVLTELRPPDSDDVTAVAVARTAEGSAPDPAGGGGQVGDVAL
jgi:hypothetical protein